MAGNSSLDIHGNMTIKEEGGTWGVENTANPGGAYAHSAARALIENTALEPAEVIRKSLEIAGDLCIYTNHNVTIEALE